MTRLSSSERANIALNVLVLVNILVFANSHALRRTYRIRDGGVPAMLLSIFCHVEPTHLLANMLPLYRCGTQLFVRSSSERWRSLLLVLISYAFCGVGALRGVELLSWYHRHQWEQTMYKARRASRCTHWLCTSLNDAWGGDISSLFTDAWSDFATSLRFTDVKFSIWHYQEIRRLGASGVVYGWMGMRVVTAWMSPYHSRMSGVDYFFLMSTLAHDLHESPVSLEDLRATSLVGTDGVDHAAHIMGFVFGMLWAAAFLLWEKVALRRWCRRGGGRRLGARWEEEQAAREQSRQRRENSRLLNPSGRTNR